MTIDQTAPPPTIAEVLAIETFFATHPVTPAAVPDLAVPGVTR